MARSRYFLDLMLRCLFIVMAAHLQSNESSSFTSKHILFFYTKCSSNLSQKLACFGSFSDYPSQLLSWHATNNGNCFAQKGMTNLSHSHLVKVMILAIANTDQRLLSLSKKLSLDLVHALLTFVDHNMKLNKNVSVVNKCCTIECLTAFVPLWQHLRHNIIFKKQYLGVVSANCVQHVMYFVLNIVTSLAHSTSLMHNVYITQALNNILVVCKYKMKFKL